MGRAGADAAAERSRMLARERALWDAGLARVAGVDEVGVGTLAGPLVAAAVVLPPGTWLDGVRDSKLMTPRQRERSDAQIRASALGVGIGVVEADEVDRLNVYQAGLRAMALAVAELREAPQHVLVDARSIPGLAVGQSKIVHGDREVFSIAAASIVAKVFRDRRMQELDSRYPGYGFARHVGYATRAHVEALRKLGPCPIHRRSFAPVRALLQEGRGEGGS